MVLFLFRWAGLRLSIIYGCPLSCPERERYGACSGGRTDRPLIPNHAGVAYLRFKRVEVYFEGLPESGWRAWLTVSKSGVTVEAFERWHNRSILREFYSISSYPVWDYDWRNAIVGKFLNKVKQLQSARGKGVPCGDKEFLKRFPAVAEYMTCSLDEGKARRTTTFNLFFEEGVFKVFANDRETNYALCVTADTFAGLWEALEARLASDEPGWRERPAYAAQGGRKKS